MSQLEPAENYVSIRDERFYIIGGKEYPRCTFILSVYPKGDGYERWLKAQGDEADTIRDKAAGEGTNVHKACERLVDGEELHMEEFSVTEWAKIVAFTAWVTTFKPDRYIATEILLWSDEYGYAGTADAVIEKDGKRYLIDYKTGKGMYNSYWLQLAAYKHAYEERGHGTIDGVGVLHLGTKHKTAAVKRNKSGMVACTGPGYEFLLDTSDKAMAASFRKFVSTKDIWDNEYPELRAASVSYPAMLSVQVPSIKK